MDLIVCVGEARESPGDRLESRIALRKKRRVGDAGDASMLHHVSSINESSLTLIIRFTK
jgi:hypothetical protein